MRDMQLAGCALSGESGHEVGRRLLAQLYAQRTGKALPEIAITEKGKPYFPGESLHFYISHTKRHAFCVLADKPVGLDAEELDREIDLALAEKILSPGEYAQFTEATDRKRALLSFWVLKEAAAKATGEGLRIYPNHTNFSLADSRLQEKDGCILAIITEEDHAL